MHEPPPPPIQTPLQDHGTAPTVQRQNAAIVLLLVILILLAAAVGVGSVITVRLFTATSPYDEFEADVKEVGKKIQNETAERFRCAAWNEEVLNRLDQMASDGKSTAEIQAYESANWDNPPVDFK